MIALGQRVLHRALQNSFLLRDEATCNPHLRASKALRGSCSESTRSSASVPFPSAPCVQMRPSSCAPLAFGEVIQTGEELICAHVLPVKPVVDVADRIPGCVKATASTVTPEYVRPPDHAANLCCTLIALILSSLIPVLHGLVVPSRLSSTLSCAAASRRFGQSPRQPRRR